MNPDPAFLKFLAGLDERNLSHEFRGVCIGYWLAERKAKTLRAQQLLG